VCDSRHCAQRPEQEATRICNDRLEEATKVNSTERKERRGFASMSPERQKEIASKGGRAAHAKGTAHEWTPEEARSAGRKGGQVSRGGRGRLTSESAGADAPLQIE
jgi:general stress protein YciG